VTICGPHDIRSLNVIHALNYRSHVFESEKAINLTQRHTTRSLPFREGGRPRHNYVLIM